MSLDQELRTVLADRAEAGQAPVPDFDALKAGGLVRRRRRRLALAALQGMTALVILATGLIVDHALPAGHGAEPSPTGPPAGPFVGRWTSTDTDGSHQTMTIRALGDGAYAMVLRDDMTGPCSGPSTDSGTGRLAATATPRGRVVDELIITGIETVCEDGGEPVGAVTSLTFVHRSRSDTIRGGVGVVWSRE
jgi:hypothetical protein